MFFHLVLPDKEKRIWKLKFVYDCLHRGRKRELIKSVTSPLLGTFFVVTRHFFNFSLVFRIGEWRDDY